MKKILASLFASAAFLAPLAYADKAPATVDVVVPVDASLLSSVDGIEAVMNKIKAEARRACAFDTSISYLPMVDKDCVAQILSQAETQLSAPEFELADTEFVLRVANVS
ncbi:MAG: UrcA family protein [Henriciella sp.]|nr:UrcA family protein [Henriciella sp.]